ncbi:MAG: WD40/YVTN/BNR-like repeat-containing protein [Nocardioidaceae bacterium]
MNPGSAIEFATGDYGWRVAGQGIPTDVDRQERYPSLDGNLAAAPLEGGYARPGGAVLASDDGGRSWTPIFDGLASGANGVWGIDLFSASTGWVVGVTGLFRTDDAGQSWRPMGEPQGTQLVSVDFLSPDGGWGLTTKGELVATADGGKSWQPGGWDQAGTSMCFTPSDGYLVDESGDIYATRDQGQTWQSAYRNTDATNDAPVWSDIICSGQDVWSSAQYTQLSTHVNPGLLYGVVQSKDAGATWDVVMARAPVKPGPGPAFPETGDPLGALGTMALAQTGSDTTFITGFPAPPIIGVSDWNWALQTQSLLGGGRRGNSARLTSLPNALDVTDGRGYVDILGTYSLGDQGWILLADNAALGTRGAASSSLTILLHTSDAGASWSTLETDPPGRPHAQ